MSDETQERGSFISFTPVVDVSFLDPDLLDSLNEDLMVPAQYVEWNTGNNQRAEFSELSAALIARGVPPFTNCLLKMY